MSGQLLKEAVPPQALADWVGKICAADGRFRVLSKAAYRSADESGQITAFREAMAPFYHESKRHYATRPMTYTRFATLLRQLAKATGFLFTSRIVYSRSTYEIRYYLSCPNSGEGKADLPELRVAV